jgi:hypothetical protein
MSSQEMVEPLEETRSELIFATEPILSSLELSIQGSGKHPSLVDLDEVEARKPLSCHDVRCELLICTFNRSKKVYFKCAKGFHFFTAQPN